MCYSAGLKKRPVIPCLDGSFQTILLVEDLERPVEFYRDSLRLEMQDGDADRYAEFDAGDSGVLLLVKREGAIAPMAGTLAGGKGSALSFSISSDGYAVWKQWLEKRGVVIDRETRWIHGGRSLYVLDPDGRRLEFKTPPVVAPPVVKPAAEKKGQGGFSNVGARRPASLSALRTRRRVRVADRRRNPADAQPMESGLNICGWTHSRR